MLLSKTMLERTIRQLKMHLSICKHNFYAEGNGTDRSHIYASTHAAHMCCVLSNKTRVYD